MPPALQSHPGTPYAAKQGDLHEPLRIAVVVGSLRRDSFNRKLANALAKLAPADFSFEQLEIDDLPLYNQDDDANRRRR